MQRSISTAATGLLLALALVACSRHAARVDRAMVLPPGAERHALDSRQRFLMAAPISDPDPAFPRTARFAGLVRLCTTFVVTADGGVADVVVDREEAACADAGDAAVAPFADAVRETVRGWRYFAAAICTFPDDVDPDDDPGCTGDAVRIEAVPIRLRYVFAFSSERGGRVHREREPATAH